MPPPDLPQSPGMQRFPNNNTYRVKKHSRAGSIVNPQKIARAFDGANILGELSQPRQREIPQYNDRPRSSSTATFYTQDSVKLGGPQRASVGTLPSQDARQTLRPAPQASDFSSTFVKQEAVEPAASNAARSIQPAIATYPGSYQNGWQPYQPISQPPCCSGEPVTSQSDPMREWAFPNGGSRNWNGQSVTSAGTTTPVSTPSWTSSMPMPYPTHGMSVQAGNGVTTNPNTPNSGSRPSSANNAIAPNFIQQSIEPIARASNGLPDNPYLNAMPLGGAPNLNDLCSCGPDCSCLMCPLHPYTEATFEHVNYLRSILEEDSAENQSMALQALDPYVGSIDIHGISQNLYNAFPNGVQSPTFPLTDSHTQNTNGSTAGAVTPVAASAGNGPLTILPGPLDSSHYLTFAFPYAQAANSCSDPSGKCMCDEGCTCVGCLTHTSASNLPQAQVPPTYSIENKPVNGHKNKEPKQKSCCT